MLKDFLAARRAGTPLICISSADQRATVKLIDDAYERKTPIITWDCIAGVQPFNTQGVEALRGKVGDAAELTNPAMALDTVKDKLPKGTIMFLLNFHRVLQSEQGNIGGATQAYSNLRDTFKSDLRTVVGLGPDFMLPPELQQDVLVLNEALPGRNELAAVITNACTDAIKSAEKLGKKTKIVIPTGADLARAVDAVTGLSAFAAEQATFMSLIGGEGLEFDSLWLRKQERVNETRGLEMSRPKESFESLGGNSAIKTYIQRLCDGETPPGCVLLIDEIEKALAGAQTDSSGVSQDMMGFLLTWMQDNQVDGMLFFGPPGAAKTATAKAFANYAKAPLLKMDIGGMKDSLVGASGANLRNAIKVAESVGGGRVCVIGTCNSVEVLPPELFRRFRLGKWYFDLPDAEEREAIWKIYEKRFGLTKQQRPNDDNWTGAEIEVACELSSRLKIPVAEAGRNYVVPVAVSRRKVIEKLRETADGAFLSSSYDGRYEFKRQHSQNSGGRMVSAG